MPCLSMCAAGVWLSRIRVTSRLQVAAGLRHLHDQGMAHLDIKPDNIYMSVDEKLYKVGDFGLVTRLDGTTKVNEGDGRCGVIACP